ncbi:MAG: DegT/DnrJ/EryC1/StrS family aminotransferase [Deltaproteobacteria bacterium]|nr:DegT/DnrJ/EryC1/StrS family aminotransferase [Deltaproteobacteria bacterium]
MGHCRICDHELKPFMSFGKQPMANGFLLPEQVQSEYFFEMQVAVCPGCSMFQLIDQPRPAQMFHGEYAFFSGTSSRMAEHFGQFAEHVMQDYIKDADPFVVEVGSNDGIMLRHFQKRGIRHLGVEPSENVAQAARQAGIRTVSKFFDEALAHSIVAEDGQADAFLGANVMCHIGNFRSVIAGIRILLKPTGVAMFEDPYLGDIIQKASYDQIYDEHVFLFSCTSIQSAFAREGLDLVDIEPQATHGGSMRYVIAHAGVRERSERLQLQLLREQQWGLTRPETYVQFRERCESARDQLRALLERKKAEGKRVVGYAATSKSTTVLNYAGIGPDLIECIVDTTPAKHGKLSPGMHIPVVPYSEFASRSPDSAVLFAWNHKAEVMSKEQSYTKRGGSWITFVPGVRELAPVLCGHPKAQYAGRAAEIQQAMTRVLEGGRYVLGDEVKQFEQEFAEYVGVRYSFGVANGTDALQLALRACDIGPGDEVITVSHTAVATVAAIELTGATPVLADVDPLTFTIDPKQVEQLITERTRAIIPVHIYGQAADMASLGALAERHRLFVIEDCAQAHGASFQGQRVGTFGHIACFSFYPTKNLGAIGDGGGIATDDPELAERIKLLREYGWAERYVSAIPGLNSRLDELQAAILRIKLRDLDKDNQRRRAIAAAYRVGLANTPVVQPYERPGEGHVYHLYVLQSDDRDALQAHLGVQQIFPLVHYPVPIHRQPAYENRVRASSMLVTERLSRQVLSLPMYPELSTTEVQEVIDAVRGFDFSAASAHRDQAATTKIVTAPVQFPLWSAGSGGASQVRVRAERLSYRRPPHAAVEVSETKPVR